MKCVKCDKDIIDITIDEYEIVLLDINLVCVECLGNTNNDNIDYIINQELKLSKQIDEYIESWGECTIEGRLVDNISYGFYLNDPILDKAIIKIYDMSYIEFCEKGYAWTMSYLRDRKINMILD